MTVRAVPGGNLLLLYPLGKCTYACQPFGVRRMPVLVLRGAALADGAFIEELVNDCLDHE
jgi:hypothetical protein